MALILTEEDSLSAESQSLRRESSILTRVIQLELIIGGLVLIGGLIFYLYRGHPGWLILGGILCFLAFSHRLKSRQNISDAARFDSGRRGEKFATKIFQENLPDNCLIINDLSLDPCGKSTQIDHLIITPAGLFVIETKAYSGKLTGQVDDRYWVQTKEYGGKKQKNRLTNPISQNNYHCTILRQFIDKHDLPFKSEDIHSLIAMVNKNHRLEIDGDSSAIDFAWFIPKKIKKYLDKAKYSREDIARLLNQLGLKLPENYSSESIQEQPDSDEQVNDSSSDRAVKQSDDYELDKLRLN